MSEKLDLGKFNLLSASGYTGQGGIAMSIMTSGDLNNDGHDDLVVGLYLFNTVTKQNSDQGITPVVLFYNTETGTYKANPAVQSQLSINVHPRQAVIGDFNGDGHNDLFIGDHGLDGVARGYQNSLLLGTGSGFVNGTALLPQITDYSHGAVAEDFNNDGITDILVLNSPVLTTTSNNTNNSYILTKSTAGNFIQTTVKLADPTDFNFVASTITDVRIRPLYNVGTTSDFNGDGVADLVLGGDHRLMIFESNKTGDYKDGIIVPVTKTYVDKYGGVDANHIVTNTPYSYIVPYDINGDGVDEILAAFTRQDPYTGRWEGRQFQVVQRDSKGTWNDITYTVFGEQTFSQTEPGVWTFKISLSDVNADGKLDLVLSNGTAVGSTNNNVWLFDNGKFVQSSDWKKYQGYEQFLTANINGHEHLLGFRYDNFTSMIEIAGWKNPSPKMDELITVKDPNSVAAQAYRLYNAAFDRTPDPEGLGYWIHEMNKGMPHAEVSARFIDSAEFRTLYGVNPTNELFLTKLYNNILERDPDPNGYQWWLDQMYTNPEKTQAKVLADFAESSENKLQTEAEIIGVGILIDPWG